MIRYPRPKDGSISREILLQNLELDLEALQKVQTWIAVAPEFRALANAMRDMIVFLQHNKEP